MAQRPTKTAAYGQQRQEPRSAGLLVEVIRTLATSASTAQKELQKERLEKDFAITGQNVDKLLQTSQQDLSSSLQSFRIVSSQLTMARERVRSAKDSLSSCKLLLQCKRDELKKLWLASAEQKHLSRLLDQIETIKTIPPEATAALSQKLHLRAAELIQTADIAFGGNLAQVEALRETRDFLARKKEELFEMISNELNRQLYVKPSENLFFELGRVASMRRTGVVLSSDDLNARLNLSCAVNSLSGIYKGVPEDETAVLRDDGYALEEAIDLSHRDTNPVQYIAVLVEAAAVLRRLPETVAALKRRMHAGMASIVHHTTVYVREYLAGPEHSLEDSKLLGELLQLLFRQFKIVAALHRVIVSQLKRVGDARRADQDGSLEFSYTMASVWSSVQDTLQQVLNDYLDIKNVGSGGLAGGSFNGGQLLQNESNVSSYFGKRKPSARPKKPSLFRFDSTTHAIKVASYIREQKLYALPSLATATDEESLSDQILLICAPTPENAIIIFKPLMKFVSEIEESVGGSSVNLRSFMEDYIRTYYLPKTQGELVQKLEMILLCSDVYDILLAGEEAKRFDSTAPILACTVRVAEICRNLEVLMQSAPVFATKFGELWLYILTEFRKFAQSVYDNAGRSLKQEGNVEIERKKISAAWAVDEDISRLLKSLPNWLALTEQTLSATTPFSPAIMNASGLATPMMESADDIRQRNIRESEILIGNLGMQKKIDEHELILEDSYRLRLLANMHESLQWFCRTMKLYLQHLPANIVDILKQTKRVQTTSVTAALGVVGMASSLDSAYGTEASSTLDSTLYQMFQNHLLALEETASTFLLMLHIEIRVHCFYFLLPIAKQMVARSHGEGVDEQVVRLNKDLLQWYDLLSANLQLRKVRHVFEGLGHLAATIFINSAQYITKINDSGKKRMCKNIFLVQQCLSTITSTREIDLDVARHYFELLYKSPDEILNSVLEKGPEFTILEYQNLLALSIRSHPIHSSEPGSLESRVSRLQEIMGERSKK